MSAVDSQRTLSVESHAVVVRFNIATEVSGCLLNCFDRIALHIGNGNATRFPVVNPI